MAIKDTDRMSTIQDIRKSTGRSQVEFSKALNIPVRTLQKWEIGERSCPDYVVQLIAFRVQHDEALKAPPEPKVNAARKRRLTAEMQKTQKAIYTLLCVSGYVGPDQNIDAVEVLSTSNQGHVIRFMGDPVGVLRYKTGVLELAHAPHIPLYAEWLTDIAIRKNEQFGWEAHPSTKKQIVTHHNPGLFEE